MPNSREQVVRWSCRPDGLSPCRIVGTDTHTEAFSFNLTSFRTTSCMPAEDATPSPYTDSNTVKHGIAMVCTKQAPQQFVQRDDARASRRTSPLVASGYVAHMRNCGQMNTKSGIKSQGPERLPTACLVRQGPWHQRIDAAALRRDRQGSKPAGHVTEE
jgi:hypothetical protein